MLRAVAEDEAVLQRGAARGLVGERRRAEAGGAPARRLTRRATPRPLGPTPPTRGAVVAIGACVSPRRKKRLVRGREASRHLPAANANERAGVAEASAGPRRVSGCMLQLG